jgi:hypothetical protein
MLSKKFASLSVVLILVLLCETAAIAAPWHLGRSRTKFYQAPVSAVHFFPQDMDTYSGRYRFGAWGEMSYRLWGDEFWFFFRGFNLERRTSYTLIIYPGSEGEGEIIILGSGTTNRRGRVFIKALADICSLPSPADPNYFYGAQIMLVPSASIEEGMLLTPGSEENLISYHAIRFIDTNGCPADDPEIPESPADETGGDGDTSGDDGSGGDTDYDNDPDVVHPF